MSKINSTAPTSAGKPVKPSKPRPDFPLGVHPAGYWCKKIRGKLHYFGPRFDPFRPGLGDCCRGRCPGRLQPAGRRPSLRPQAPGGHR